MAKDLTDKQAAFLAHLSTQLETGKINYAECKRVAGYSEKSDTHTLVKEMAREIVDLTNNFLIRHAPAAAMKMVAVMDDPTSMIAPKLSMEAAEKVLDRAGIVKKENVTVNHNVSNAVLILPPKDIIEKE